MVYNFKKHGRSIKCRATQTSTSHSEPASRLGVQAYNVWIDVYVNASAIFLFHNIRSQPP